MGLHEDQQGLPGIPQPGGQTPPLKRKTDSAEAAWVHWLRQERAGWLDAVSPDPLLPEGLLPKGYLGQQAAAAHGRPSWPGLAGFSDDEQIDVTIVTRN